MSLGSENRKHIVHLVYNLNSLILLAVSYAEAICTVHNIHTYNVFRSKSHTVHITIMYTMDIISGNDINDLSSHAGCCRSFLIIKCEGN